MSTAARHYGIEWSATRILEIVALERPKTIGISGKIRSLQRKRSYRSRTLARYLASFEVNAIYVHKGNAGSLLSIKIDDAIGPVCSKEQIKKDIETFIPKVRDPRIKGIYKRIAEEMKPEGELSMQTKKDIETARKDIREGKGVMLSKIGHRKNTYK